MAFNLYKKQSDSRGFFVVEILVVLAILAILTLTIVPQYMSYTTRTKLQDIIMAANAMKDAVTACITLTATATGCNGGTNNIPASYNGPSGSNLGSVGVTDGVITATASNNNGLSGQTAVLTPTLANGTVTWCLTGSSDAGLSASCSAGGGGSGFSCSGNTCTYNGTTYTMWPTAQSGYVVGSVANFAVAMSGHSRSDMQTNGNLGLSSGGDFVKDSSTQIINCSLGSFACTKIFIKNTAGVTVGAIYAPGTSSTTAYTWQTTVP